MSEHPIFFRCKLAITVQPIIAVGRYWHKECFVCVVCGQPLGVQAAALHDDMPLHTRCRLKSTRVAQPAASGPAWLTGARTVTTPGGVKQPSRRVYSSPLTAFQCAACNQMIGLKHYLRRGGLIYHTDCFLATGSALTGDTRHHPVNGSFVVDTWGNLY